MKPADRTRLTAALRDHVARIAVDLRKMLQAPGATRNRALQLHVDEKVAEDFDVWTDLLSRRAAVLWVLKSVYVRVLEDRGLLKPGRLLDPEAQQLFEKLAPRLGETAFLRWLYRDLASPQGGLPELFSLQPAEIAFPSNELSKKLIEFWRYRDADTGSHWSFAEERFEGELMGDLYQELDPVVKDRFALCQTPDFVRAFILDRTLTPAIETFGADTVRMIDPACGSGHFLIDGLKRLVAATQAQHPDWSHLELVTHALERVVGIDLNDYACGLARARLVMTAAELTGVATLAEAAQFHPHVYWGDGLEQVEREEIKPSVQYKLFEKVEEKPRAVLTRSDVREALKKVFATRFHAVVANPPYNAERDALRKVYHRDKIGTSRRYVSAHREYSLCCPFTERSFQLAGAEAFVGLILANNFMTRDFGTPLIEKVLAQKDLTLVADLSGAILAESGFETPTLLLFARNRPPTSKSIRALLGKKGDTARSGDLSQNPVWKSLLDGWASPGFDNAYVSVDDLPRNSFGVHPWSLRGGGAAQVKQKMERSSSLLATFADPIGFMCITKQDEVFVQEPAVFLRLGAELETIRSFGAGEGIRDWVAVADLMAVFPYGADMKTVPIAKMPRIASFLWRYRTILENRAVFGGGTFRSAGRPWWEYGQIPPSRFAPKTLTLVFPAIATHNHFSIAPSGAVFKQSGPVVQFSLQHERTQCDAILAVLNSSALCFWFRQVLHKVGGRSSGTRLQSEPWAQRMDFAGGLVGQAPLPQILPGHLSLMAQKLDALGREFQQNQPSAVLEGFWRPSDLVATLEAASQRRDLVRNQMVAVQEELDWAIYEAFGFLNAGESFVETSQPEPIRSENRPFAIRLARAVSAGEASRYWFDAMGVAPTATIPNLYSPTTHQRITRRIDLINETPAISLLEAPEHKRKWEPLQWDNDMKAACFAWLATRIEEIVNTKLQPTTQASIVASLQNEAQFFAVLSVYQSRRDIDLDGIVSEVVATESVPNHPVHTYTESGLSKMAVWEEVWALQRQEDSGVKAKSFPTLPEFSQGSRGKSMDFLRAEYWHLRGKLDVPKERFIAFTEVPGRTGADTLYGWAGWTPLQRIKAILAIDEELEDGNVPLADRTGLLDSAWRLLPDAAREDAATAGRLKAELQALVGPEGPSREMLEDWRKRFPPPNTRAAKAAKRTAAKVAEDDEEGDEA